MLSAYCTTDQRFFLTTRKLSRMIRNLQSSNLTPDIRNQDVSKAGVSFVISSCSLTYIFSRDTVEESSYEICINIMRNKAVSMTTNIDVEVQARTLLGPDTHHVAALYFSVRTKSFRRAKNGKSWTA